MRSSTRHHRTVWYVVATLVALLFAIPLSLMLTGALRQPGMPPPSGFELVPSPVSADGYRGAFANSPLARSLLNSLIVAAFAVPLSILVASWAGFAIARARGAARTRLLAGVLLLLMVPVTAVWIPRFAIFKSLGLVGTYVPLIAPALLGGSPFFVLLYALAFRRVPQDLYDAAALEGASPFRIWRRIGMPLARSTTVAVGVLAFLLSWGNFIDPLLYLRDESTYTAPLALRFLEQLGPTNWPVLLAGSAVVTAPVLAGFFLAQRYFLSERSTTGWFGR